MSNLCRMNPVLVETIIKALTLIKGVGKS